ncbi:uncharacterized protein LOC108451461 [Gossypium arboreum]|uniref:uncharacterized protein LOC108451461 n=1 Tax=Gossypium arboreum TaxID=29729 RepID=UPI0008196FCA|nr:uncharacterized protein LOC108451461 [Gossypium arboreum]
MMSQLSQLLMGRVDKGKGPMDNVGENNEDPQYPSGFTPIHVQTQHEINLQKPSVTIRPQQFQARVSVSMNFQASSGYNPSNNSNNPMVPDLDEVAKEERNEVNNTNVGYLKSITVSQPKAATAGQVSSRQESGTRQNNEKIQFTPIPMTYKELYQSLLDAHMVAPFYLKPLQLPFPKWYDTNAQCEYHARIVGHSIENFTTFKKLVERFINMGIVKFDNIPSTENPLPNHTNKRVNTIDGGIGKRTKRVVSEVKTPLRRVWKEMARRGLVTSNTERNDDGIENYCEFHHKERHKIQEYEEFRAVIQGLMDKKEMEFYDEVNEEEYICAPESTSSPRVNYPVVIISCPKNEAGVQMAPKIIIQRPVVFSYKDSKQVPWNYDCTVTIPGKESSASPLKEDQNIGSHTRSGRRYDTRIELVKERDVLVEQKKEKAVELNVPVNEPVKEEEVKEFLKFLKHSEYSVSALMKVLNETYVTNDISVNKLDRLVNNISVDNFIFFNDDEIPPRGMGSTKALHITTKCKRYTLLGNIVRAFDGTERRVMERIEVPLLIGPTTYEVDFLVMDIKPSYNCLLERPWIHSAGAVPSSLHQKLKLVSEGRLVTINAEEDIIVTVSSDALYVETDEEAIECSFQSLEFVNVTFITEGSRILEPKSPKLR